VNLEDTIPEAGALGPGEPQAQLVVLDGATRQRAIVIDRPAMTIGRQEDCDLVLASEKVSRRHGRVSRDGAGYGYEDLGSFNGSFLNGRKLEPNRRHSLRHKDVLQITAYRILFLDWSGLAGQLGLATISLDSERIRREADAILKELL
jgi:pSer/pThr/pTyr-binding forkhead associated (FHA) protein